MQAKTNGRPGASAPRKRARTASLSSSRRHRWRRTASYGLAGAVLASGALTGCVVDRDGDGVSDVDEVSVGWDPTDPDQDGNGILDGVQDSDGDGVTDWVELSIGTDPSGSDGADADSDGLDDEHEAIMGTDPLDQDTDDDQLLDTEFLVHQTNPTDADTDADGLGDRTEIDVLRSDPRRADGGRTVESSGSSISLADRLDRIDPTFWTQCSDHDPLAFDELSVVDGWVTASDPDDGPIDSPVHGAAHGCGVHEFGSWAADDVEVEWTWSAQRPLEATPLLHVDLGTDEGGIGMWPGNDLFPEVPGSQSVWALGYIGRDNAHFEIVSVHVLTPAERAVWSDPANPAPPARMMIRSSGGTITVHLNGQQLPISMQVPDSLRGSTTHGFAIDNNQTTLDGGPRTPDLPAGRGPWTIAGTDASWSGAAG